MEGKKSNPTLGEQRLHIDLNTTNNSFVDQIKKKTAELINLCEEAKKGKSGEVIRVLATAQTEYESASHFAVKSQFKD